MTEIEELQDAHHLLQNNDEELRSDGLRSVLVFFRHTLMCGVHPEIKNDSYEVSSLMSGDITELEHAVRKCWPEHQIKMIIGSYTDILKRCKSGQPLEEGEAKILQLKMLCIACIGLILKNWGGFPTIWESHYPATERLFIASISARSVFEKWIDIPELGVTLSA